ncbi:MAG: hypothetical protein HY540_07940 [Deltaproteobacteria bacterium]|nr:hypothetical protein [Deltaproteobacteria bacterium]
MSGTIEEREEFFRPFEKSMVIFPSSKSLSKSGGWRFFDFIGKTIVKKEKNTRNFFGMRSKIEIEAYVNLSPLSFRMGPIGTNAPVQTTVLASVAGIPGDAFAIAPHRAFPGMTGLHHHLFAHSGPTGGATPPASPLLAGALEKKHGFSTILEDPRYGVISTDAHGLYGPSYSFTHPGGKSNGVNEDTVVQGEHGAAVLDGVSTAAGAIASEIAAEHIFDDLMNSNPDLNAAFLKAHAEINARAPGSSTVAVAYTIVGDTDGKEHVHVFHAGDAFAVLFDKEGNKKQRTEYHNLAAAQAAMAGLQLSTQQLAAAPGANVVLSTLGGAYDPEITEDIWVIEEGDRLLLSSDGLEKFHSEYEADNINISLGEILAQADTPEAAVGYLADEAMKRINDGTGKPDNLGFHVYFHKRPALAAIEEVRAALERELSGIRAEAKTKYPPSRLSRLAEWVDSTQLLRRKAVWAAAAAVGGASFALSASLAQQGIWVDDDLFLPLNPFVVIAPSFGFTASAAISAALYLIGRRQANKRGKKETAFFQRRDVGPLKSALVEISLMPSSFIEGQISADEVKQKLAEYEKLI